MSNLPLDWSTAELRRAASAAPNSFIDGDWIEAPYITNQGIRLIQTGNIGRASFLDKADTQKYISRASFRLLNCKWVNAGDLLICRLADPIGRACEIPVSVGEAITSVDCTIFRVEASRFDKRFVLHWLNSAENLKNASDKAAGSTRSRISRSNLGKLPIPEPDLNEQGLIAQVLDTLDTAIHETEAIIAKLKAVKQGMLHDLLTRGIAANGELRPTQAEVPHLYKWSPLGWIPKDWEEVTLGEIARRSGGLLQTGPFGSQLHAHEYVLDGIPVIMPQDMVNGEVSVASIARISQRKATALSRHRVQPNDLVFSRRGDLSRCVAIEEEHLGWLCGTGCLLARLPGHEVNGYWLALVYTQPGIQTQVMGRAVGSTMANLNTSILAAITIARPPVTEQSEIARRLKSLNKRIRFEEEELEKRQFEKSGLMDDLLTGRVRVTPLLAEATQQPGSA